MKKYLEVFKIENNKYLNYPNLIDKMKRLIVLLIIGLVSLGCIAPTLNQASFAEFDSLKEKFGVTNAFSSNTIVMNDYINQLSLLRSRSSLNLASVLDAELYSANAFYYYSLSNQLMRVVTLNNCDQKDRIDLERYLNFTISNSQTALQKIDALLFTDTVNLKINQRDVIEQIKISASEDLIRLDEIC